VAFKILISNAKIIG